MMPRLAINMPGPAECIMSLITGSYNRAKTRLFFPPEFVKSSHFDEKFVPMHDYFSTPNLSKQKAHQILTDIASVL